MVFSFELIKANEGDCFLLHFGTREEPGLALIDGGPKTVYHQYLKTRLEKIKLNREFTAMQPLPVDLLMVSHVDEDHIQGILDLMKEEVVAQDDQKPQLLNILDFWHNSFDEIIDHSSADITASMKTHFGEAAISGTAELPEDKKLEVQAASSEDPEVVTSGLKVLASIEQGFRLRLDADKLGITRNLEFDGKLVQASQRQEAKDIAQDLKFTVVGPMAPELEALRQKHLKWLEDLKKKGKPVPQALAAYVDASVPNLSSIVVLAESGGKRMLLTGDARGDKIIEGLQLTGLLGPGQDSTISVDLLKVPHHGSARNLEEGFFKRIIARHYVISANGKYSNPDRGTLEMLWNARGEADYTIHLTYEIAEIDQERQKDSTDWSPARDSLDAFFKDHNIKVDPDPVEEGKPHVSIVKKGKPHIIDLLEDKVGF